MRTKGVLLLGLIVCWTAVCNGEDGFLYDYGIGDVSSKELAEDYLFRADATILCTDESPCGERQKCVGEEGKKTCQCADGLGGENCEIEEWCEKTGKFENCKGENGKCEYSKEKRSVVCTCDPGKKLHPKENICKDGCSTNEDCKETQKCVEKDGWKSCKCADGLSGNDCEKNDWCEDPGKFKYCNGEDGTCEYSKEKRSVVCTCPTGKKFHPQENKCKDGCSTNEDCKETQKCVEKDGWKTCKCADGLSGNNCEKNDWCEDPGKFKDCKGEFGTCKYSEEKRSVVCTCATGKKLHPQENICKDSCSKDEDCTDKQRCVKKDGFETCKCADGLSGKDCEKNDWCQDPGKFKDCKGENGTCEYIKEKRSVVCTCATGKKLHPIENICKDACSTNTECTEKQRCVLKDGWQTCKCADGLSGKDCEKNDWCEDPGKFKDCKGEYGTCEYSKEKRSVLCTCATGKKVHPKENICKETCNEDTECKYEGKCEMKVGGNKFCSCKLGLTGDKCQTVFDCSPSGKYKGCENSGGKCKFDGSKAVCECSGNKKLYDKENVCKDTCSKDEECKDAQKCVEKDGWKTCQCADGLSGDDCEKLQWCEGTGKFKNCKGDNGTCEYSKEKRTVVCTCAVPERKLHPNENRCRETCADDTECKFGGKCEGNDGGNKFCSCNLGLTGDKCQTVFDCSSTGKYKGCENSGGKCKYDGSKAVCECSGNNKLHDKENVCKECDCGPNGECSFVDGKQTCKCKPGFQDKNGKCTECDCGEKGTCSFVNGNKKCGCSKGYSEDNGMCKECNCGENGTCSFENGNKKCRCSKGYSEDNGLCKECDCGENGKCDFKDGQKNCTCSLTFVVKAKDGKCHKCDCGSGGTCHFEDDTAECTCKEGFKEYQKKCKECDCGQHFDCELDENGNKKCDCGQGYALKRVNNKDICVATCEVDSDCENKAKCQGPEGKRFCSCSSKLGGDKCEIVKDCVSGGKYSNCVDSGGECGFDGTDSTCTCNEPKKLDTRRNFCRTKCSSNDVCKHGAKCSADFCQCLTGTQGDECDEVILCKTLKCDEKDATCKYNSTKSPNTFCECNNEKYIFVGDKCVEKCKPKDYCQNGGTCNTQTNLCKCKPNTSGDKCEKILGCEPLKCKDINAECVYDQQAEKPTCKCENNYYYEKGECKPEWCRTGCKTAISTCLYEDGVGICKCKTAGNYYDYTSKTCKKIDLCFNKTCEDDLICSSGKCQCPDNHKENGTRCEQMDLCKDKSLCFPDAKCEAGSSFGYVKCTCNSASAFYNPKTGKCSDGSCFLPDHRKDCKKPCPQGMTFKDGDCKHDVDTRKCDNDCGFLGWCYNVSKTEQKCVCLSSYAAIDQKTKKCVLKASEVCPTTEKDGDNKCKCTGKYKQATNGITCELKSCSDEDVQKECKSKGAIKCVENWKKDGGYKCVCPDGYVDDSKKGCIDPCSQDKAKDECSSNGQVCYIGDRDRVGDCRCPPTFTYNETKKSCDLSGDNTFMIHGLPVLSEKYETPENNINKVVLNRDVAASMKQAFANLDFVHVFSFKVDNEVLLCDVWLQFKSDLPPTFNATLEVRRWQALTVEGQNEFLLPPQLLLSSSHISATSEELTLCTDSVRRSVCGSGSICESNKCKCGAGFREIDSTIKAFGDKRIVRCEDIDECTEAKHDCKENTTRCVNTLGDYFCVCKSGFKKAKGDADALNKEECIGLCDPNPCNKGSCKLTKENNVDCTCTAGYSGSYCNRADVNLAKAGKSTKVVGAVLGTLLAIVIILIIVYIVRQRKNSYSEDFTPAPRVDNAEMIERRPMRGVTNRAYQ